MDLTTMSYNNLRKYAVELGFEGNNPKRTDLVTFIEAKSAKEAEVEETEEVEEVNVEEVKKTLEGFIAAKEEAKVAAQPAAPTAEARRSDKIKTRRDEIFGQVVQIFSENSQAMHWGGVVQKWEKMTGQKHDRVSWHDIGHALRKLCASGTITATTPEKGRVVYQVAG